ncbi:MAG: hypothetical protein R3F30_13165 [Planctomycetota bacterium]
MSRVPAPRMAALALAPLLLLPAILAGGETTTTQDGPRVPCVYCKDKGFKECRKHSKADLELEDDGVVRFCSDLASCKECLGTLMIDCDHCKNAAVEEDIAKRAARLQEWLAMRRKKVDEVIGHQCLQGAGDHVDLVWDLKPMMVGKRKVGPHEMLHLYIQRMEALRKDFIEVVQIPSVQQKARIELYAWRDGGDQYVAASKFAGQGSKGQGVKFLGSTAIYTMLYDKSKIRGDEDLHRNFVHNVAHLLLANADPAQWIGQLGGGWIDEGFAHYFEHRLDLQCTTHCFQEVATDINFKPGNWLVPVRRKVAAGRLPSFAEVAAKNTDQLDGVEHMLVFSYVHFLLEGTLVEKDHGKAFMRLVDKLKAKQSAGEALRYAYKIGAAQFEEKWKEWVLETYPTR